MRGNSAAAWPPNPTVPSRISCPGRGSSRRSRGSTRTASCSCRVSDTLPHRSLARKLSLRQGENGLDMPPRSRYKYVPSPGCPERGCWSPLLLRESQATLGPGGHPRPPLGVRTHPCSGSGSSGEKGPRPQLRTCHIAAVRRASTTAATYPRETQPPVFSSADRLTTRPQGSATRPSVPAAPWRPWPDAEGSPASRGSGTRRTAPVPRAPDDPARRSASPLFRSRPV